MRKISLVATIVIAAIVYNGCASSQSPKPTVMPTPAIVTPVPTSTLSSFDYPPASSPGAINPAVTQANIHQTATSPGTTCVPGWTATVRPPVSYTNNLKRQQMAAEGMVALLSTVEEDHIVPIEVGGDPKNPRNLFPQPKAGPHGAVAKDHIENEIHRKVCAGTMSLAEGQAVFLNHQW